MLSNKWRDIKFILASLMSISICKASELDRFNPDFLRVSDGVNAKEIDLTYFEKNDGLQEIIRCGYTLMGKKLVIKV